MSYLDTLFVDGTDIRDVDGMQIIDKISGLTAPGTRRGSHDPRPGDNGGDGQRLPLDWYIIRIPVQIAGATRGERNDNWFAIAADLQGDWGLVTLERRIATGSGDEYRGGTAPGALITGLTLDIMNHRTGRSEVQFYNLKGGWSTDAGATYQIP